MTWNLYDRLLGAADSDQSICIEKESGVTLTYAELAAISARFAGFDARDSVHHRLRVEMVRSAVS